MATVSFANMDQSFDVTDELVTFTGAGVVTRDPAVYAWTSQNAPANGVVLLGSGFTYNGGPIAGTVSTFMLDLGNDSPGAPEILITGLAFNLAALGTLGGLTPDQENDLVWRTLLAGNDTVDLASAGASPDFGFEGDGRDIEPGLFVFAGDDAITGNAGAASGKVAGDFNYVSGALYGGNDTINVTANLVSGDAFTVFGFLAGGHDTLTVLAGVTVYGDASGANGSVVGGNDTITLLSAASAYGDALFVTGNLLGGNDTIRGSGGNDTIYGDWGALNPGAQPRGGNDMLYGEVGNDTIKGNGGNDFLDGGANADALDGGDGNDRFNLAAEAAGIDTLADASGIDTVLSTITRTIAPWGFIENLILQGVGAINGSGNAVGNSITGNGANNVLVGQAGNDTLIGGAGNDFLRGDADADTLYGGIGLDTLTGGAGNDHFVFNTALSAANRDRITDLNVASNDTIRLENAIFTGLGAANNHFLAAGPFNINNANGVALQADDRIIYDKDNGQLWYDSNGSLAGGVRVNFATVNPNQVLTAADFYVI